MKCTVPKEHIISSPALEADFISSDVKVTIRKYCSNLAKKLLKEVENTLLSKRRDMLRRIRISFEGVASDYMPSLGPLGRIFRSAFLRNNTQSRVLVGLSPMISCVLREV